MLKLAKLNSSKNCNPEVVSHEQGCACTKRERGLRTGSSSSGQSIFCWALMPMNCARFTIKPKVLCTRKAFVTTQGVGGSCTQLHDTHHARIGERCKQERDDDEQDNGWDRHGD